MRKLTVLTAAQTQQIAVIDVSRLVAAVPAWTCRRRYPHLPALLVSIALAGLVPFCT